MGSLRKSQIDYLRSVKNSKILPHMSRWRMIDDLKGIGIDISDRVWVRTGVVRRVYQAVLDSIDSDEE